MNLIENLIEKYHLIILTIYINVFNFWSAWYSTNILISLDWINTVVSDWSHSSRWIITSCTWHSTDQFDTIMSLRRERLLLVSRRPIVTFLILSLTVNITRIRGSKSLKIAGDNHKVFRRNLKDSDPESCYRHWEHCNERVGCGEVLTRVQVLCMHITECSCDCRSMLVALLSSKGGLQTLTCKCNGHQVCDHLHNHVTTCYNDVISAMTHLEDPAQISDCDVAEEICRRDADCHCLLEPNSRSQCRKTLTYLADCTDTSHKVARTKARKLYTCRCNNDQNIQKCMSYESPDTTCVNLTYLHKYTCVQSGTTHSLISSFLIYMPIISGIAYYVKTIPALLFS